MADLAVFTAEEPDARRVMSVSIPYSRWSSFKMGETIFLPQLRIVAPLGRPLNPPLTRYQLEGVRPLSVLTSWSQTPRNQQMKGVYAQRAVPWSPRVEFVQ